ncbi:hypothetical protein Leryth_020990 [Lithospermum erythrorhizon]|nr:hypothetical protein Leryth_020990 [Lithospermum erythrorhizon]
MAYTKSKTVRFEEIPEPEKPQVIDADDAVKVKYRIDGTRLPEPSLRKGENESRKPGATLKAKVLSRMFSEDFERVKKKILDPREPIIHRWNKIFLVACLVSLFVDPLFFYLPVAHKNMCIDLSTKLEVALTITRSVADIFYIIQIFVRFRTAYIAPSSLIFGRGELVIDSTEIALKFWELAGIFCQLKGKKRAGETYAVSRSYHAITFSLTAVGLETLTGMYGTRQVISQVCVIRIEVPILSVFTVMQSHPLLRLSSSSASISIFIGAKSFYLCDGFCIVIHPTLGLVLFGLLIGNMTYLQSTTVRLEEWRIRRTDTEQWMHHRQLPQELRQSVRKYDQYKWMATRGVDEESLLKGLPLDLRRSIKCHLCYDLVRRVPLFDQMDKRMLDAICERLKPALCTEGTCVVREGDPVNEMLFIIRGNLDSHTTNGGRTGFFNSIRIGPGDFCGEELLTWALDPRPSVILPSSTRSVKAISEVEAFALHSDDLMFVAAQFRRLHSKQLRHKFRFYSHQWRTWAACFIQTAWRRFKKRKNAAVLRALEGGLIPGAESLNGQLDGNVPPPGSGFAVYAARMAASRRGLHKRSGSDSSAVSSLQKPAEPDFSVDDE